MKTAIIIPAYNEELTIEKTIIEFQKELKDAFICVIDNNSIDKTNHIAKETIKKIKCKGIVLFEKRQGKANAIRKAFREINADIYVMVDADLTYPARFIRNLISPVISGNADMTVGNRHSEGHYKKENKRLFHNFGNSLVIFLINHLFKADLKDIMSGYRAFNKTFVKNFPVLCEGFELETELTIHALDKRFTIEEIPIAYNDRPEGSFSKLNTFKDGIKVLSTIFNIFRLYKPLNFFGFLALLLIFTGLILGSPVLIEFFLTGIIKRVPLAILSTGIMIIAMISFTIGLVLDTIIKIHNFDYELNLNKFYNDEKIK